MKRKLALIVAAVMLFSLFAACGKKEDTTVKDNNVISNSNSDNSGNSNNSVSSSTEGSTLGSMTEDQVFPSDDAILRIAIDHQPSGLTQPGQGYASTLEVSQFFYECLIGWDSSTNSLVPKLATEWEWIDDLTLRLKLRDGVISANGDPFTASDVLFTMQWGCEVTKLATYYSSLIDIENCKVIDDYTYDLAVHYPYPYMTIDLTHFAYQMAVEASVEAIGGKDATTNNPAAGTGPYKLTKWDEGICVYMERRDDYWGTTPYYKSIEFITVGDATARVMGVESGDFDTAIRPSATAVVSAKESDTDGMKGWIVSTLGSTYQLGMNSDSSPLNVKEVRQAIAMAINYDAMIQVAASGIGEKMDSIFTSNMPEYSPLEEGQECYYHYDLEAAKAKLQEAGYADGFTINCKYRTNDAIVNSFAEMLQNQFKQINITFELVPMESAPWYADLRAGSFDTYLVSGGQINPRRILQSIDSRVDYSVSTGGSGKSWMPEELGEVLDKALSTLDEAERNVYFKEIQDVVREYVPMIFICQKYQVFLTTDEITNLMTTSQGVQDLLSMYPDAYVGK